MTIWKLIIELRPELFAYARSIADTVDEAEELVADAMERVARAGSAPDDKHALRLWMFRTIRNLSIDELRKRRVRREYSELVGRHFDEMGQPSLGAEDQILVRMAFEKLSAMEREVLFLVDIMGMKYVEAAEVMSVPTGTVMSRISRARKALLDRLGSGKSEAAKRRGDGGVPG